MIIPPIGKSGITNFEGELSRFQLNPYLNIDIFRRIFVLDFRPKALSFNLLNTCIL